MSISFKRQRVSLAQQAATTFLTKLPADDVAADQSVNLQDLVVQEHAVHIDMMSGSQQPFEEDLEDHCESVWTSLNTTYYPLCEPSQIDDVRPSITFFIFREWTFHVEPNGICRIKRGGNLVRSWNTVQDFVICRRAAACGDLELSLDFDFSNASLGKQFVEFVNCY